MPKIFYLFSITLLLSACATTAPTPQQIANAPLVDAGLISADMAKRMASEDADKIQQLIATAQPEEQQTWKNQLTHDKYQFTSLAVSVNAQGQPCRTYQLQTLIHGDKQQLQAKACRRLDGDWQGARVLSTLSLTA